MTPFIAGGSVTAVKTRRLGGWFLFVEARSLPGRICHDGERYKILSIERQTLEECRERKYVRMKSLVVDELSSSWVLHPGKFEVAELFPSSSPMMPRPPRLPRQT